MEKKCGKCLTGKRFTDIGDHKIAEKWTTEIFKLRHKQRLGNWRKEKHFPEILQKDKNRKDLLVSRRSLKTNLLRHLLGKKTRRLNFCLE